MFFDGTTKRAKGGRAARNSKAQSGGDAKKRLLQQAREERQERSRLKLRTASARTVQAAVRSFLVRKSVRQAVREGWDREAEAATAADEVAAPARLLGRFLFFYTHGVDAERADLLVQLTTRLVAKEGILGQLAAMPGPEAHHLELLLRSFACVCMPGSAAETEGGLARRDVTRLDLLLMLIDVDAWCEAGFGADRARRACWGLLQALSSAGVYDAAARMLTLAAADQVSKISRLVLRPFDLGLPGSEAEDAYCRLCCTVLCVPNLDKIVAGPAADQFRCLDIWSSVLSVVASRSAVNGLMISPPYVAAFVGNMLTLGPSLRGCSAEYAGAYFFVLGAALPSLFGHVGAHQNLFDTEADDDDAEDDDGLGHDADSKRLRVAGHGGHGLQPKLEALIHPRVVGSVLATCFSHADHVPFQNVCYVVEWLLRNSSAKLSTKGPRLALLNHIAFQTGTKAFLLKMWASFDESSLMDLRDGLVSGGQIDNSVRLQMSVLILFCECYSHLLSIQDDDEFRDEVPFTMTEVQDMVTRLRNLASDLFLNADIEANFLSASQDDVHATRCLLDTTTHLLRRLFTRDSRRKFCELNHWVCPSAAALNDCLVTAVVNVLDPQHFRWKRLLVRMPFAVPFETRIRIFHERVRADRVEWQHQANGADERGRWLRIRRNFLFEDAVDSISPLGQSIKDRLRVQFVDVHGMEEAGIDGGGLFKEFMHMLVKNAFGPTYALFKSTAEQLLYPNPSSGILGQNHLQHFRFLGLILGKALYEGVLIDLPLAGFFLSKILGRFNFVDDLPSLDEELYRNLMFLKTYEGDCDDLGLNFAIVDNEFDESRVTELIKNGENISVTNENRVQYIHYVANYRLNAQIRHQSKAFLDGLRQIIPIDWLHMFSESELQQVISGTRGGVDLADLRAHTNYSGGYNDHHPAIELFWYVMGALSDEQQSGLLKFATSSDRAPLLGFKYLNPAFCIHRSEPDLSRLPTASTCMNLLKLPPFETEESMREKLIYAIASNEGFSLS